MSLLSQPINWIGILAAAVAVMVLGWVWFAALFARAYASVLDRPFEPGAKMPPLFIAGPSLCMLVTTVASAFLMPAVGVATLPGAIGFGTLVGVGYLGSTAVNMAINPLVSRPLAYGLLSASYFVVASILISIVLFLVG
ncbi:DUF1761 domain-containing protein [Aureimonas psammosilenae]|uniref:DUF1761 domain-containing protein n=1 Tax=Aureimonas psammosilenae TaxID=2495496 RepID=UPI0012604213|nr:DUF1761 domain-containing protein [Aureimonas psammosilenae]